MSRSSCIQKLVHFACLHSILERSMSSPQGMRLHGNTEAVKTLGAEIPDIAC